jgi:predicted CoA-substrate-specific enzyme activase
VKSIAARGSDTSVLGVDIGSVSVSCALAGGDGGILRTAYRFHEGKIGEALSRAVMDLHAEEPVRIAFTSTSPRLIPDAGAFDSLVSLIEAVKRLFGRVGGILYVGGEKFGLIRFDGEGNYLGARGNSSCAAGTGSFLDQQARRLGLGKIGELARIALANTSEAPKISTRCAVFARTDLVHAQAAGYTMGEICDGLCRGLAQNIADTLLAGKPPDPPVVFAGGVAGNEAVRRHLEELFTVPIVSHELSPVLGAYGAALCLLGKNYAAPVMDLGKALERVLAGPGEGEKSYFFNPLPADGSGLTSPCATRFEYGSGRFSRKHPVEVEIYRKIAPGETLGAFIGIDIGSTSTKAILIDKARRPLAGFYTRTSGAPMSATQALAESAAEVLGRMGAGIRFLGAAATGAGRKFIGKIIGADVVVDEITAHAKAAYELDPKTDTIIEIGGQDAKFTTMRDGMVTFSHLNTVCAAGTGSFLEEQAARLGCPLSQYSERVRGVRAPLASDRCAVFMERDINNYLGRGYSTEEILAAALFSVRENYLQKVARGASIGSNICFQGATARNAALVAAFEQGLGRPISVSPFCHLAGALGAALIAAESPPAASAFRGFPALLADEIPIHGETCTLCTNHCRIRLATIAGETVAYGFLCGRDYDTARYVGNNRSGFDLLSEWRKAWGTPAAPEDGRDASKPAGPVIGIPAALTLCETMPLWEEFFRILRIPCITSRQLQNSVLLGKEVAGAEFCAPLTALHGHARWLLDKADLVFLPVSISDDESGRSRMYCYYTQFGAALASGIGGGENRGRFLMPLVRLDRDREGTVRELLLSLRGAGFKDLSGGQVSRAFDLARRHYSEGLSRLVKRFEEEMTGAADLAVVLIGRPYAVLSAEMAKGIPGIFASLGVKAFSQEMLPEDSSIEGEMGPLRKIFHWKYPVRFLSAALTAAKTPFLYPVFVTSFKCSPDSFSLEYFKRILDSYGKPYLVLQLDDHDSSVGYETRIEAGVAAFRNHAASGKPAPAGAETRAPIGESHLPITRKKDIAGKTLLMPNWDPLAARLLAANLRREGLDARALDEDPLRIRKAMRSNSGQCIPLNVIAQDYIDYVESNGLDPGKCALWMISAGVACNIFMFPSYLKALMEARGGGFEKSVVYSGDITHYEISVRAAVNAYRVYLIAGLLRRTVCRLRPYEIEPGAADRALSKAMDILVPAFEGKEGKTAAVTRAVSIFDAVRTATGRRPKVAIFGDLYVRDNDVFNQDLVRAIEDAGGEAVTTPYTEYCRIVADAHFLKWRRQGEYQTLARMKSLFRIMRILAADFLGSFERFLGPQETPLCEDTDKILSRFGVRIEHDGESFDNLLKVFHLARAHPDLALFVQVSPVFCCPALVTEAMARDIQLMTGVPVVSLTYDGTGRLQNDAIVPYIAFPRGRSHNP